MLHHNHSIRTIEIALGSDYNTIHSYLLLFKEVKYIETYLQNKYIGCVDKMTEKREETLDLFLDQHLRVDAGLICQYVLEIYRVEYSALATTKLLHHQIFSYKQTIVMASQADEWAQEEFIEQTLPAILDDVESEETVLQYADGFHPRQITKSIYGWIYKEEVYEIDCNSGRRIVNINVTVNDIKPEQMVYEKTQIITLRIRKKLLKRHLGQRNYYVCVNTRCNRNKMFRGWAKTQRIAMGYAPSHSPSLIPIERWWRLMKREVINSVYYDSHSKFKERIDKFIENRKGYKTKLRNPLIMNYQTLRELILPLYSNSYGDIQSIACLS